MIKNMQTYGVISFFLCVICMFLLYQDFDTAANWVFMASMLCLLISLGISLAEIQISNNALNIELSDIEDLLSKKTRRSFGQMYQKNNED